MRNSYAAAIAAVAVALAGCNSGDRSDGGDGAGTRSTSSGAALTGAGATFPYPIYSKWFADYARETGVRINYQSIGSGGGIRQLSEGTVDFGASDSPMTDEEMSRAKGPVLHIPTVIGAVVIAYNVPGLRDTIRLTGAEIADIFLGRITRWNDPRLAAQNPGLSLPASDILVVHRSDGSGTTYVFTDYLASVSREWATRVGRGKEVNWPTGLGGKGNEGVAGQVKQTPGSVAYMELAYAKQNGLQVAAIRNASGNYVTPTIESIRAAADGAVAKMPPSTDYRISIVNSPGANAYPISSFTWLLLYRNQLDARKGKLLVDFLRWAMANGDRSAAALDYAPLPDRLDEQLLQRLDSVRMGAAS